MNKRQIALLVLVILVVVLAVDLLVGNYISARLATTSWARKWGLFNTQAPIVVTNRETVRVNTNNDLVETAENAKTRTAVTVRVQNGQVETVGGAVNWTSDGYFISAQVPGVEPEEISGVLTNNGELFPVESTWTDPATGLVIIKTAARDLIVFSPAEARDIRVGQQVVMIQNSLSANQTKFFTGYVSKLADDVAGQTLESDFVARRLTLSMGAAAEPGSAVLNLSGRMVGIWTGLDVIMADDVRDMMDNYLTNNRQVVRPRVGFSYQQLSEAQAKALQTQVGVRIMGVANNSPASKAGLRGGDIIIEADGQGIDADFDIDNWLREKKPGQTISLSVQRGTNILNLLVTIEQL